MQPRPTLGATASVGELVASRPQPEGDTGKRASKRCHLPFSYGTDTFLGHSTPKYTPQLRSSPTTPHAGHARVLASIWTRKVHHLLRKTTLTLKFFGGSTIPAPVHATLRSQMAATHFHGQCLSDVLTLSPLLAAPSYGPETSRCEPPATPAPRLSNPDLLF